MWVNSLLHTCQPVSVSQSGSKSHWLSCQMGVTWMSAMDQSVSYHASSSLLCWETVNPRTRNDGFITTCFFTFPGLSPYPSIIPFQFPLLSKLLNKCIGIGIDLPSDRQWQTISFPKVGPYILFIFEPSKPETQCIHSTWIRGHNFKLEANKEFLWEHEQAYTCVCLTQF